VYASLMVFAALSLFFTSQVSSFAGFLVGGLLFGVTGASFAVGIAYSSVFFPREIQGTALGIQAGLGNFGVSVTQFLAPVVIGISMVGSSQVFTDERSTHSIYLQNAAFVWVPFILLGAAVAWFGLKSVPVRANFREQLDIFRDKHTWLMTSLYIMTFGSFSGYAAVFPLLIKETYSKFPGGHDPLAYAFLGPLLGALLRVLAGPVADRFGGARVTQASELGLLGCAMVATFFMKPTGPESWVGILWSMLGLFFFNGIGNASTFKQMTKIFPPRQAGGVIRWTSAIAAYGPFVFSALIGATIARTGSATSFFYGAAAFYALNIVINWWFYARRGAEKPC